ncbi:MAG: hypothetical protein QOF00_4511 [Pseudonocardiales bacterium]|nr:hypothetical protein [Pseudonocardiales bacterium]
MDTQAGPTTSPKPSATAVDEPFAESTPISSATTAPAGVFDDEELDEFLTDRWKMRDSDIT